MRQPHGWHTKRLLERRTSGDLYRFATPAGIFSLLACSASLLREVRLPQLWPCSPLEQGLIFFWKDFSKTFCFGSNILTFPCTRRMADMSAPTLRIGRATSIYSVSLRRRPNPPPSVLHLPTLDCSRTSSLGVNPTANGVSSSLVRLPHFHKAPSSDGASFFASAVAVSKNA